MCFTYTYIKKELIEISVFGITGTNGKTSVTYILRQLLEARGETNALIGTIMHNTGKHVYNAINTTPSKALLKEYFQEIEMSKIDNCIMEISSHGIAQKRIEEIDIHYGAFTNLSRDHLDYHQDMWEYFKVKRKLFDITQKGDVINIDDSYGKLLYDGLKSKLKEIKKDIFTVSQNDIKADVYGNVLEHSLNNSKVAICFRETLIGEVIFPMMGKAAVYNLLIAIGLAIMSDKNKYISNNQINAKYILDGLAAFKGVPGRFEVIGGNEKAEVIIDYAHTPDALEMLLKEVRANSKGRIITVFGCGGDRDKGKRFVMGKIAGALSDYCIITSDNSRSEKPIEIMREIERGMVTTGCNYSLVEGRYQGISRAAFIAKRGDVIVIAGKGHENYPFNDKEAALEILGKS